MKIYPKKKFAVPIKIFAQSLFVLILLPLMLNAQYSRINFQKEQEDERNRRQTQEVLQESDFIKQRINARKSIQEAMFNLDVIEDWIDPETYTLGSGDVLSVNVAGSVNKYFEVLVSPEGKIDIPGLGTISVRNKRLAEVRELVQELIGDYFKDAEVFCNLVAMRPMKVYVLGEVYSPGAYLAKPVDRLFELIGKTGGMKDLARIFDIRIQRGGKTIHVDGTRYLIYGEMKSNPVLKDGDVIYIPKAIPYKETITIQGGFLKPGIYPVRPDEKLSDFLMRQSDFSENAELNLITISRKDGEEKRIVLNLDPENPMETLDKVTLHPGDIIEIGVLSEVYVQGEVKTPGAYPFVAGFKAIDYIGLAGGNTYRGNSARVKIYHADGTKSKGLHATIYRGDVVVVPESFSYTMVGQLSTLQILYYLASTMLTIEVIRTR